MKGRIDPCVYDFTLVSYSSHTQKGFFSINFKVFFKIINLAQSAYLVGKGLSMQT